MKITITFDEVRGMVLSRYALPSDTVVSILRPKEIPANINLANKIVYCLSNYGYPADSCFCHGTTNIEPGKKISAIKALREFSDKNGVNSSLFFCKCAIENFDAFIDFVKKNGYPSNTEDFCNKS